MAFFRSLGILRGKSPSPTAPHSVLDALHSERLLRSLDRAPCVACALCIRLYLPRRYGTILKQREEELPRRIAFVSDKVFEPRWYQRFWRNGPALGFASAAMLSCAILVHAFNQPSPVAPPSGVQPVAVAAAAPDPAPSQAEIYARVEAAVAKAVAGMRDSNELRIRQLDVSYNEKLDQMREWFEHNQKLQYAGLIAANRGAAE